MATDVFQNFTQAGCICVIPISRDASKTQGGAKPLPDSHSCSPDIMCLKIHESPIYFH